MVEDLQRAQAEWDQFVAFVGGLTEDVFALSPALDPRATRPEEVTRLAGFRGPGSQTQPSHRPTG